MDAQTPRGAEVDATTEGKAVRWPVPLWLQVLFWTLVASALLHWL